MDLLSHLRATNIDTPAGYSTIILAAYIFNMTRSIIAGTAPLKAWRNLVRLVLTSGYPLQTLVTSPFGRIQLRTLGGRRRSYLCWAKDARVQTSVSPRRSTPPRSSPRSGAGSRRSSASSSKSSRKSPSKPKGPAGSGRITKWPTAPKGSLMPLGKTYGEPIGLNNPRAYCYRRSLLQCLVHLPALYNEIVEQDLHSECYSPDEECIACAFKDFVFQYWNDRQEANFPRRRTGGVLSALDEVVNACGPENVFHEFANDLTQGDPWIFFTYLFKKIQDADDELFSAINRLFQLTHETTRICPDCGEQVVSEERNIGLSLSIRKLPRGEQLSLVEYLREHHRDFVEGADCANEACIAMNSRSGRDSQLGIEDSPGSPALPHPRIFKITEAPQALAINLKRGQYDNLRQSMYKVEDIIDFQEELDLTEFTKSGEALKYRLYGVVAHHGKSVASGHWIAAVRHRNGIEYRIINDSDVEPANQAGFDELREPWSNKQWFDPTVLLYLKMEDGNEA